ncbi:uncharacterized protein PGTG_21909 [Puccinia graminis f. sp. tritici CRL 75-36-700-3]|uniref:DNA ligase n=1 Tax=Puccinia graminis f. sp. tritici (strain CRL 75-36-700-3 / race SCCL) TaxID=418459 RepID=H6QT04_PUCGT|nr:uncharacterized protein PGTG_21909 [Puccinia graminis f. sp. tritici CRL 75-36-700-3]EHS63955.1 hypothetical protein PGTG_21909 [Puccinia graminis f. sp. tritici CRL 75-36-700-3]
MTIHIKTEDEDEPELKPVKKEYDHDDPLRPLGPSPSFHDLCRILDAMECRREERVSSLTKHRPKYLKALFEKWRKVYGNDLYPCIRLLLPKHDRNRPMYFLKEFGLGRLYCDALSLDKKTSSAAKRLLSWKSGAPNQNNNESSAGDFAKVLYKEIDSRSMVAKTLLSIDDINDQLDSLATARSGAKRLEIVKTWLEKITPKDHLWLLKIILQDLRLGLSESVVLCAFHHNAYEYYNICTDLKTVCHTLHSTHIPLEDTQASLKTFNVFKPMLSKRSTKDLPDIVKLMLSGKHKEFLIEEKMDGERIQLHKSGEQYQFWSRSGTNYTDIYGANPTIGCLTPFIHSAFKPAVEDVILDGEMLVWDPKKKRILPFGSVKSLKPSSINRDEPRALFKVFDILYLKGKGKPEGTSLINKPLSERRQVMESGRVFVEIKTRLEFCYSVRGKDTQDIKASFEKILEESGEGLIIKRLDSKYRVNARTDDWYKVKPDYMDELGETFEVLAVGAFWGRGKRGGTFGSFLVALVDNENSDPLQGIFRYKTLCRVGTGLTTDETTQIMTKLEGKYSNWDKKRPELNPDWLDIGKGSGQTPDVWWHWKDSFVLTIKGTEIINSYAYGCQFSIRFPRSIRFDMERDIGDCMPYQELLGIANQLQDKNKLGENLSGHVRKRKRNELSQPTSSLMPLKRSDSHKIFYGAEFWVLQGLEDTAESKSDLEVMLNRNGGKIIHTVPRPAPDREHFCITRRTDFWDAEKAIRHGLQLVHPQWVHDSMEAGYKIVVTSPKYAVNTAQPTVENSISQYTSALAVVKKESDSEGGEDWADEQSDATTVAEDRWPNASATEDGVSDHDLRDESPQLSHAKIEPSESVTDKPLGCEDVPLPNKPLDTKLEAEVKEGIFYPLVFYLDNKPIAHSSEGPVGNTVSVDPDGESSKLFSQVSRLLKAHGGRIVSDVNDPDSTHIICSPTDTSRCVDLRRIDKDRPRRRRLVTADWVLDSVEGDSCLYEADYLP